MTKSYTTGNVTFGAAGRRWTFTAPNYNYVTPVMPGGRATAAKIANAIKGAIKRSGTMDNLGRANRDKIFHTAALAVRQQVNH